mgnify:CR=1 FL=1
MAVILSPQDEMRLKRAIQNSPRNRRIQEMQLRVENAKRQEEERKQKELDSFEDWKITDMFVEMLEVSRDANVPKTIDEDWNETCCLAIQMIPEARRKARELWLNYSAGKGVNS